MTRPFEGIRIIDITDVLAGPFAAYQLAVLGADVIKVEDPNDPDQSRDGGTDRALNRKRMGTSFLTQGSNKRAITLNLKSRGQGAALTDAGLERLMQAYPSHLSSVRRHVMDHLGGLDSVAFAAAMGSVAADEPGPPSAPPARRAALTPACRTAHDRSGHLRPLRGAHRLRAGLGAGAPAGGRRA